MPNTQRPIPEQFDSLIRLLEFMGTLLQGQQKQHPDTDIQNRALFMYFFISLDRIEEASYLDKTNPKTKKTYRTDVLDFLNKNTQKRINKDWNSLQSYVETEMDQLLTYFVKEDQPTANDLEKPKVGFSYNENLPKDFDPLAHMIQLLRSKYKEASSDNEKKKSLQYFFIHYTISTKVEVDRPYAETRKLLVDTLQSIAGIDLIAARQQVKEINTHYYRLLGTESNSNVTHSTPEIKTANIPTQKEEAHNQPKTYSTPSTPGHNITKPQKTISQPTPKKTSTRPTTNSTRTPATTPHNTPKIGSTNQSRPNATHTTPIKKPTAPQRIVRPTTKSTTIRPPTKPTITKPSANRAPTKTISTRKPRKI